MKKIIVLLVFLMILSGCSCFCVSAETKSDIGAQSGVYTLEAELPDEVQQDLESLGIFGDDYSSVRSLSFSDISSFIVATAGEKAGEILPSVGSLLASLLIYSVFSGLFENSSNRALETILGIVSSLCIACILLFPVTSLIDTVQSAIDVSADFMLAFIPVMTAILISSGQALTGSGYCSMMIIAAETVAQFFSKFVSPLLSCFLSVGISASVVPEIKIGNLVSFLSKSIKWVMSFVFTIFTSLLTLKSIYTSSVDNVSSRAVRYTMSSFVPVVGGALAEAYRTVHGSVGVLKSGAGIFVIIAVIVVFLPVLIKLCLWLVTINISKCFAETSELISPKLMLESVSGVLSLLISVILCIVALFVVTTALIITIGGNG